MRRIHAIVLACLMALSAASAEARNTEHFFPAAEAAESERGEAHLLPIPFFLKGQSHGGVEKEISHISADHSTRGAFRSDATSCRVAFLSAVRALQVRAEQAGGDAIIDVVSTTRGMETESATDYRCVAGAMVVHVGLKGTVVKLSP